LAKAVASILPKKLIIAYNEGKVDLHAKVKVRVDVEDEEGNLVNKLIETTMGRVMFNEAVPNKYLSSISCSRRRT
jgi:DNA-directed RNA polymerase subunit beta'